MHFSQGTTTEVSDSLEGVENIINMLDEIMEHMDGFSSAEEARLSSITETLRMWRYVTQCLMRNLTAIRALGVGRGMECPGILFPHGSPVAGAKREASPLPCPEANRQTGGCRR